ANVGEEILRSLSRDDIKDLLPGPEHFLRRRALWLLVNNDEKVEGASSAKHVEPSKPSPRANSDVSEENLNTSKFLTMSSPEYIVYTDGELEQARTSYFEQKRLGSTTTDLSKELFCRLSPAASTPEPTQTAVRKIQRVLGDHYDSPVSQAAEDPEGYLQHRPLSCPILLVSKDNCMIATGNTAVTTFESAKLEEGLVYLMAYYYTFHLTYPKCISTLLSVLQTEVLQDSIHERDATSSYKKAIAEWKSFTE
ncbi:hypothetical protein WMY93_032943, partial [Mugilogobius chulae]